MALGSRSCPTEKKIEGGRKAKRKEKDEQFGYIQDLVGWWLYEDVDKVIWIDEFEIKVDKVEEFTDYLIREYGTNDIPTN